MDLEKKEGTMQFVENIKLGPGGSDVSTPVSAPLKTNSKRVMLVPQPSDDPRDPLNWPTSKKICTLAIVCIASFAGTLQALANASGFFPQAELYGKAPIDLSYSLSASIAGLAVGPLVWSPLSNCFGRSACIMWSMVITLCVNIWSANMTRSDQYIPFVVSRLFGGLFGSAATTVGANIIIETFFLHDRGKCFMVYTACILLGSAAGGTLSGFIIQTAPWPIQFWYNVGLEALVAVLCILLLDETGWTRPGGEQYPQPPTSFMKRKLATYTFTQRLRPHKTPRQMIHLFIKPLYIGLYPVTILVGLALSILFSWSVITVTAISLFLQTPVEEGGYGFTPYQNAYFTFTFWLATAIAQVYGHFVNDRLPLYICSRNGGVWKPEYRLHALWFPVFFVYPIALGLFGATLYNHWHFMVLAVSNVCLNYCGACITGPTMNYIVEAVRPDLANEAAAMMNLYRLAFSLGLPFYIFPWISQVGQNWTFGMMAFFTIFTYGLIITVINFGEKIRTWNFLPEIKLEDSVKVI